MSADTRPWLQAIIRAKAVGGSVLVLTSTIRTASTTIRVLSDSIFVEEAAPTSLLPKLTWLSAGKKQLFAPPAVQHQAAYESTADPSRRPQPADLRSPPAECGWRDDTLLCCAADHTFDASTLRAPDLPRVCASFRENTREMITCVFQTLFVSSETMLNLGNQRIYWLVMKI